jgi:hypothetical protein
MADFPRFYLGNMPVLRASTPLLEPRKPSGFESSNSCAAAPPLTSNNTPLTWPFFFACRRSCEYLKVQGAWRTKTIRQGDLEFRRRRAILPLTSPTLHLAKTISILFRDQNKRVKGIFRTARATSDPDACPVAPFAQGIHRVSSLPGSTADTLIYNYKAASNAPSWPSLTPS